jgi:carbon monoxide dehydrogenase subunit G
MTAKNYAASFTVDQSPDDVFAAINNPARRNRRPY